MLRLLERDEGFHKPLLSPREASDFRFLGDTECCFYWICFDCGRQRYYQSQPCSDGRTVLLGGEFVEYTEYTVSATGQYWLAVVPVNPGNAGVPLASVSFGSNCFNRIFPPSTSRSSMCRRMRFLPFSLPPNALRSEYAGHYPVVECRPRFVRRSADPQFARAPRESRSALATYS